MSTPAGWYPQPDGRQRWWDGYQWTESFAPGAAAPVTTPATGGELADEQFQTQYGPPMGEPAAPGPGPAPGPAPVPVQVQVQKTGQNGLAIAGFILALLGALVSFIPIVNFGGDFLAFLGLIFAVIGLAQSGKRQAGKALSIAAIILAVVAFVISVVVNTTATTILNNVVKSLPSITATQSAPAATANLGDPITLNGIDPGSKAVVTALKVVDPTTSTDGISTPAAGTRYVAVQFQIQNTGTVAYDDAPDNGAKVMDANGQKFGYSSVDSVSSGPKFPATITLAPGEKALGYIVFEVPTSSKVTTVQFGMDSGYGDSGKWTVP
jgi:hypothetical protein